MWNVYKNFSLTIILGKYVASQSDDKTVRVWKTSDWKQETVVTEPFEEVFYQNNLDDNFYKNT